MNLSVARKSLALIAAIVAFSTFAETKTIKFAWWRMNAVVLDGSAVDARTQVLSAANVDVMAGVGLSVLDAAYSSSNGYRLENCKTVTNGSCDGLSRVFALSDAYDAVASEKPTTPMVHGTKNVPAANASIAWTVFDVGQTRLAALSGFIYQIYNSKFKDNFKACVANVLSNGVDKLVFGLQDGCKARTLTAADFEECGLYAVRDGSADGYWILCSDQAMAAAASSTVAALPGATTYGAAGYAALFVCESDEEDPEPVGEEILVGSASEFVAAVGSSTASGKTIRLTADISLPEWTDCDFAGTLDGAGYSISGLTSPLFATLEGKVMNLTVASAAISEATTYARVGVFARTVRDGGSIVGCRTTPDCQIAALKKCPYLGGIAGAIEMTSAYAGGEGAWIADCTNAAQIAVSVSDDNTTHGFGGIVGLVKQDASATCGVVRCENAGTFAISSISMNIGGIVGRMESSAIGGVVQVDDCCNLADVDFAAGADTTLYKNRIAGGIVAHVSQGFRGKIEVRRSVNRGLVDVGCDAGTGGCRHRYAGGVVGKVDTLYKDGLLNIEDSAAYGAVDGDCAGGVIGEFGVNQNYANVSLRIFNCAVYGSASGRTNGVVVGNMVKPKASVNRTRTIGNCFLVAASSAPLASGTDSFAAADIVNVIRSSDAVSAATAANMLGTSAGEGHFGWVAGCLSNGEAVPELEPFATLETQPIVTLPVEVVPEFVCNPNATRWSNPGSRPGFFAREVQDLHIYNGKIYTAGGDWGAFSNQGPVPIFAIDPATGSFTNEFEAGTEMISDFKTFSDGRLWAGSVDNRESHENTGHFFRRELDGTWTNLTSCISGHNGVTANYAAHTWDIAEFGGKLFTAGYGICASSNWGDTRMTDATPDLTSPYRIYLDSPTAVYIAGMNRYRISQARKFVAFMPFEDDLFCFSQDYGYKYDIDIFEWEEWRWDAAAGKFVSSIVPWSDVAPGITEEDKAISVAGWMGENLEFDIRPSHCRKFGSRVLYLIEGIKTNVAGHSRPWAAYSAVNQNHHVKATKIDLGGARPFDIHVSSDAAYIVAAKGTEMGSVVTNSVWKTEDGVTFTELFHFATNRHATALCKYGDDFYVGMGYSTNVCNIWKNLPKDPELSGDIYRIRFNEGAIARSKKSNSKATVVCSSPVARAVEMLPAAAEQAVMLAPAEESVRSGSAAPAAPVEVAPMFVCNPNATRWSTAGVKAGYFAREVQDLHVYNGKIYTAGGDWGAFSNQGPVPIFAINPATGSFTNEFEAGTELITDFKTFSDGRLWAGSVDVREKHEHAGHFFRREADGMWTNLMSCISGHNGATANYAAHIWDIAEFGGKFFTAGYGICASSNWGDTRMTDATPDLTTPYRTYFESSTSVWIAGQNRFNVGQARKFAAFMPFDDDLFCFSMDYGYKYYMDIFEWEEWRWNASLGKFVASLVPWSDIAPGITEEDKAITVSPSMSDYLDFDIRPSHCRRFGSRVLYLIEGIKTNVAGHSRPWAAYSAVNQNHHVKATKIDLGGARPFDIHVSGDAAYIVAAKGTEMGTVVTNSVWKTEDGVTFTELFHFATNRHATALCKYGDDFYVGMGYSTNVCNIWKNLPKDPELSGAIFRVNLEGGSQGGGDPQGGDDPQGDPTATNAIRVAGWPMSNKVIMSDPSARSALYSKLGEQGVDFVYICGGKADDEYGSDAYGFVKCQTNLNSNSYYQMALGYDKGKYDLLASIDTTTPGCPAHLDSNAIVAEGIYLEHRATKERFFFMAYAGLWANFANASTKSWFQSILSDISDNHPSDKVILIFPVSKSPANMEPYLTDTCNFDELHYATNVTDFAVFASHGQFSLTSVQSVVDSAVSPNAEEGLFTLGYNSQGATTYSVQFLDKDGVTVIDEITVAEGAAATPPETLPLHEGEHFVCWMLGESVYDITAAVTSDLTLVASYASSINDGVWEIGSYDEFAAAITEVSPAGARYRLTADINLAPWCAVDFRGILDGDGHTLEGLGSPLFNTISGGRVQNLVIASSAVEEEEKGGSIGFIARTLECGASVSNCTIKAGCLLQAGVNVKCGAIAGNIVKGEGYAHAGFSGIFDCTNHAAIEKIAGDYNNADGGIGGIVGHVVVSLPEGQSSVECRIERCFNDGPSISEYPACNLGGIVGYAIITNDAGALSIVGCQNAGSISNTSSAASTQYVTTHAGGIVGYVDKQCRGAIKISRCGNRGTILCGYEPEGASLSRKCAGGLVGCVESFYKDARLAVVDSANYGAVSGHRAAGFVAQIGVNPNYSGTYVVLSNVANYAAISCVTNVAQAIGCSTVPNANVTHVRRIFNAFFETSVNQGVPLFGDTATTNDFTLEDVISSNAASHGYSASTDRSVLNVNARGAGLVPWVRGQVGGIVVPELSCFRKKAPRFVISLR